MRMEPSRLEMILTKIIVHTPAEKIYRSFANLIDIQGNEKIIDFGSGYGTVAKFIAKRLPNGQLICADISANWQKKCKRYLKQFKNISYFNDDLYKLDETESYDIAYAHFVLHDIPNQELERVIRSLYKLLKNKGKLYIREPLEDTIKIDFMESILKQNGFIQSEKAEISIPLMGKSLEAVYIKN